MGKFNFLLNEKFSFVFDGIDWGCFIEILEELNIFLLLFKNEKIC